MVLVRPRTYAVVIAVALAVFAALIGLTPSVRWRLQVVGLRALGQINDIGWADLLSLLKPSAHQSLEPLVDTRNPYMVLRNPLTTDADLRAGQASFANRCASCHGRDGEGSVAAPALRGRRLVHGASDWALYRLIRDGVSGTAMPAHELARDEVWRLAAYVRRINVELPADEASGREPPRGAAISLPMVDLRSSAQPGSDWLTYSGSYDGMRHSSLEEVTPSNVADLRPAWIYQISERRRLETSPIVVGGAMFITAGSAVVALDAASGTELWSFDRVPPEGSIGFPGLVNRGVAVLGDAVYVATGDAHLLALSASTGTLLWDVVVADYKVERHFVTGAPLAIADAIVVGTSVRAGRGQIASFDAKTGATRWRFNTIPGPSEPGHDTWLGDSWRQGGGSAWMTGTYEPATDTLYWGVGNPKPDYNAFVRKGDNLYTNSVVALEGATGRLRWHFQFTPGDDHDWDAAQIPVIVDVPRAGGIEKLLLTANRNGFFYVLDRSTGRFIAGRPFVKQTWAESLTASGRPVLAAPPPNSAKGYVQYPSNVGGTSWWSPTVDPALQLFFVPVLERGQVVSPADPTNPRQQDNVPRSTNVPHYTAVRALKASTGELVWEHKNEPRQDHEEAAGLLSTRTGLVFASNLRRFFALDSKSGRELWAFNTGGLIAAAPVSYMAGGRQYVSIAAGSSLMVFALADSNQRAGAASTPASASSRRVSTP